eukprot:sb/3471081/
MVVTNERADTIDYYLSKPAGRVDMYVQSLDKNFMVPVGGSIVAGFTSDVIKGVSQVYPDTLDDTLRLTLFHQVFSYLKEKLTDLAKERGERVLDTPQNLVSLGLTLTPSLYTVPASEIGSRLFLRNVTGVRVVVGDVTKTIGHVTLECFGSHAPTCPLPYMTFAGAVGMSKGDVDVLVGKVDKLLQKCSMK